MTTNCSMIQPLQPDAGKVLFPANVRMALYGNSIPEVQGNDDTRTRHGRLECSG